MHLMVSQQAAYSCCLAVNLHNHPCTASLKVHQHAADSQHAIPSCGLLTGRVSQFTEQERSRGCLQSPAWPCCLQGRLPGCQQHNALFPSSRQLAVFGLTCRRASMP